MAEAEGMNLVMQMMPCLDSNMIGDSKPNLLRNIGLAGGSMGAIAIANHCSCGLHKEH